MPLISDPTGGEGITEYFLPWEIFMDEDEEL